MKYFVLIVALISFFLVSSSALAITSIKSGNWNDPATWDANKIPTSGDNVTIASGTTVIYNVLSDNVIGEINISGTLRFARDTNTRLKTNGNIIILINGFLDIGTSTDFIPKNIKAEIIWVLTQEQANAYIGGFNFQPTDKGLWVFYGGRLETHGFPLLRTWSKLAQDAPAGSNFVIVENNVSDWYTGGTVVISPTVTPKFGFDDWQDELRTITAITPLADGKTQLTLDKALTFNHSGTAPMRGEIGLLTRNILFKTEIIGKSEDVLIKTPGERKFAHTLHSLGAKGSISYTEFKFMGNENTLSRYTIHQHQMNDTSKGMILRGNGLWYTGNRWINIHNSNGILVEDNVGYSSVRSGYFMEQDFEPPGSGGSVNPIMGNIDVTFSHNLGVRMIAPRFGVGFGTESIDGAVFWIEPQDTTYSGNIAVGAGSNSDNAGFFFSSPNPRFKRPFVFLSNEVHNNNPIGLRSWSGISDAALVDVFSWGQGTGLRWGGYVAPFQVFQSRFINNTHGVSVVSVGSYTQDSLLENNKETGYRFERYVVTPDPNNPARLVRNIHKNNGIIDLTQVHDPCVSQPTSNATDPFAEGACSAEYLVVIGSNFQSPKNLDFGWQPNHNSFWQVINYTGTGNLPKDFILLRKDQLDPANQTNISKALISPQTFYSPEVDALVTPLDSLPDKIEVTKINSPRFGVFNFTLTRPDIPPEISLDATLNGKIATLKATVKDDKNPSPRVEFFMEENLIANLTSSPYETTVDLSKFGRKFVYLYARAFDGHSYQSTSFGVPPYAQRSYSKVIEIGPEVILAGQQLPQPIVIIFKPPVELGFPEQFTKAVANGSDITFRIPITYNDLTKTSFSVRKPSLFDVKLFRLNESGVIKSVTIDATDPNNITWTGDTSRQSWILVDVPAPIINKIKTSITPTIYQKNFTIAANNTFSNVQASIEINPSYTNWKLYWWDGISWRDVTTTFNLQISGNVATFSGFGTSEQQFRLEGSTQPPTQAPQQPAPSPVPTPSGGGAVTVISKTETPIEPKKDVIQTSPTYITPIISDVAVNIETNDIVENGEPFKVTLILKSNKNISSDILLGGKFSTIGYVYDIAREEFQFTDEFEAVFGSKKTKVNLTANEEKRLTFDLTAPAQLKGGFSIEAKVLSETISEAIKPVMIDYKPLVLDVTEKQIGERKSLNVTIKSFEANSQTEFRIIKDNKRDVYFDLIQGKKEYNTEIELLKPGIYTIKAITDSQQGILDEDIRYVTVPGAVAPEINFGLIMLIIGSAVILFVSFTLFRRV